jgi:hypothetical protein
LKIVFRSTVLLLLIAGSLMAAANIDTVPAWNGTSFISSFGIPNTATYGQTITVAPGTGLLLSFAFEMTCNVTVVIRGEVYAWDGNKATGPSLFESTPISVTAAPNNTTYQLITINTGGVALAPGAYVLFVTTSRDAGANSTCRFGSVANTTYPDGLFVFQNNGTNFGQLFTNNWSTIASDLAFQASFVGGAPTVPAPSTLTLVVAGLIAVGLFGRFRAVSRSSTTPSD